MPSSKIFSEPLQITPILFQILLALAPQERHGYGVMKDVLERSDNTTRIGAGTMYSSIKKLLEVGWIEESEERPDHDLDDQRRRYYRLTGTGRQAAEREAARLEQLVQHARSVQLLPGLEGIS
jgi:DNA-binding PadR family transcriptional regulator